MKNSTSALQIFWSLLWRATVFAPLFLGFQAIVIASGLGRFWGMSLGSLKQGGDQ
jgi:hypothetical protein